MNNIPDINSEEARIDRFLERFLEEGFAGAIIGGEPSDGERVAGKLIARLFPTPLLQLRPGQDHAGAEVERVLEQAVSEGKVLFITLTDSVQQSLLRYLEQIIEDETLELSKPQGWSKLSCHEDFRLLLYSFSPALPLLNSIPLKLRLNQESGASLA